MIILCNKQGITFHLQFCICFIGISLVTGTTLTVPLFFSIPFFKRKSCIPGSCNQSVCSSVRELQPQPREQSWFSWKMLSGELHRRWPVNEAFKIIFVTSTAKKKKNPTICLQGGLLRIRCLYWSLRSCYNAKASSEIRRTQSHCRDLGRCQDFQWISWFFRTADKQVVSTCIFVCI